jgi:cysteine desulfurase
VGTRKGMRPGTEAAHQIAGMAKALELSYDNLEEEAQISELKKYLEDRLH